MGRESFPGDRRHVHPGSNQRDALAVVVPFMLVSKTALAVRVSNAVALVMLFTAGYRLDRYAGVAPRRTGIAMAFGAPWCSSSWLLGG